MKIRYKAISDVGRKRSANEDSYCADSDLNLYVVADGMGGHAAGEVASKVAVESIVDFIRNTSNDKDITWPYEFDETLSMAGNRLKSAIQTAHAKVLEVTSQKKEFQGMATTVVSILVAARAVVTATSEVAMSGGIEAVGGVQRAHRQLRVFRRDQHADLDLAGGDDLDIDRLVRQRAEHRVGHA